MWCDLASTKPLCPLMSGSRMHTAGPDGEPAVGLWPGLLSKGTSQALPVPFASLCNGGSALQSQSGILDL